MLNSDSATITFWKMSECEFRVSPLDGTIHYNKLRVFIVIREKNILKLCQMS